MSDLIPLRVCYFGTYRAEYSRNRMMIAALRQNGVEVSECHASLWRDTEDRVQAASGGWLRLAFLWRALRAYAVLLVRYLRSAPHDVLMVGYPAQTDVFLARLLSRLRGAPLVWDVFMSVYLIAVERGLDARSPRTAALLKRLERVALRLPDLLIQDTAQYVAWLVETHGVDPARFRLVPTGADDRVFRPVEAPARVGSGFRVLYYGTFIPNHGVPHIIEAARLLSDETTISFELIGDGPERAAAQTRVAEYGLANVTFTDWLSAETLAAYAATFDVCLGAFGTTPQSLMTVHNKVYEALAMARPVITGDSAAMRGAMVHGTHAFFCARANSGALAEAIRTLYNSPDLCRSLAENGHRLYIEQYDLQHNGARCVAHLQELLAARGPARMNS